MSAGEGRARCACAGALVLLVALLAERALAHQDGDKRAEMSPVPFVLGSRYGRSPPRLLAPRNDRFFMGSRYGKRSEAESLQESLPAALSALVGVGPRAGNSGPAGLMLCEPAPAPLLALYRCHPAAAPAPALVRQHLLDNRRNEDDPIDED